MHSTKVGDRISKSVAVANRRKQKPRTQTLPFSNRNNPFEESHHLRHSGYCCCPDVRYTNGTLPRCDQLSLIVPAQPGLLLLYYWAADTLPNESSIGLPPLFFFTCVDWLSLYPLSDSSHHIPRQARPYLTLATTVRAARFSHPPFTTLSIASASPHGACSMPTPTVATWVQSKQSLNRRSYIFTHLSVLGHYYHLSGQCHVLPLTSPALTNSPNIV